MESTENFCLKNGKTSVVLLFNFEAKKIEKQVFGVISTAKEKLFQRWKSRKKCLQWLLLTMTRKILMCLKVKFVKALLSL